MLGLGVGIDYALFIVTRYRDAASRGIEPTRRSLARSRPPGGAVVFAGSTVVIALVLACCSRKSRSSPRSATRRRSWSWSRYRRDHPASGPARRCSARRINALRVPFRQGPHTTTDRTAGRAGPRASRKHPWPAMLLAIVLLLALAIPVLDIAARPAGQRRAARVDHGAPGIRRDHRRLRVGTNGPLLLSVDSTPAGAQPTRRAQPAEQAAAAGQQQQQAAAAGDAAAGGRGRAGPQAQQQAEQQAAVAAPDQGQQQKTDGAEEVPAVDGERPPAGQAREQDRQGEGRKVVSPGNGDKNGDAAVFTRDPEHGAVRERDRGPRQRPARQRDPGRPRARPDAYVGGTTAGYIDLADRISERLPLGDRDRASRSASCCS